MSYEKVAQAGCTQPVSLALHSPLEGKTRGGCARRRQRHFSLLQCPLLLLLLLLLQRRGVLDGRLGQPPRHRRVFEGTLDVEAE